ncbi:PREDICTED: uncharacterized protein LOC100635893 isoform X3 [Amphimedon queenslandica]|uniref:Tudor domain-containing protein n=1 Tax=Amphimedon queenslandica TaxID=400682 RepID=A0AAN0IW60_AMPQE|nr:PREDICTED: uncharacterized protein LOC100635893 isoform X2 [Amphimedon queenslandica]XP_019849025.1 PREDICTED: uncharacterized protein LOC100635893 isoform X3 [Amphimedon queenslandica]|eukprot:XP_019849024.1 PREDICTED: uncharacterized protein LOC100635893 isoform X2 [Amphimedon queenslandica]
MSQLISYHTKRKVFVTTVAQEGLFYVHLDTPEAFDLPRLSQEIAEVVRNNLDKNRSFSPSVGAKCFAQSLLDNTWYRSLVMSLDSPTTYSLYYLDYGYTEANVPVSRLFPHISKFFEMPYQAVQCQLANFVPKDGVWTEEVVAALSDNINMQEVPALFWGECPDYASFLTEHDVPCYLTTLYWEESSDYTVAEEMVSMAMGTHPEESPEKMLSVPKSKLIKKPLATPPTESEATPTGSKYAYLSFEIGLEYKIYISHAESPDVVWGQFSDRTDELNQLVIDLQSGLSANKVQILEGGLLAPGEPCCVRYSDGNWCRGLIDEWDEASFIAKVLYVDYGNTESVEVSAIFSMPRQFFKVPAQAVSFSMAGIRPVSDKWSPEAIACFEELYTDVELLAVIKGQDEDGYPSVELKDVALGQSLGDILIQEGHAISIEPRSPPDTSNIEEKRDNSVDKQPTKTASPIKSSPTMTPTKKPSFNPFREAVVPVQSPLSVSVPYIVTLDKFYCQINDHLDELNKLSTLIGQYAVSPDAEKIPVARKNLPVLAKSSEDDNWYRARLCPPEEGGESKWSVDFVDYGNSELVNLDHVRVIPESFLRLPIQAFECSYCDIDPSLVENDEIINSFFDMVAATPTTCMASRLEKREGRSVYSVQFFIKGKDIMTELISNSKTAGSLSSGCGQKVSTQSTSNDIPRLTLVTDRPVSVVISNIESPLGFSCQLEENSNSLSLLVSQMTEHYNDPSTPTKPVKPVPGTCCAALFDQDSLWYRGRILCVDGSDSIEILFIDYGNKELIMLKNTRDLLSKYLSLPIQAVSCSLTGIKEDVITDDLITYFQDQCLDNQYQCQFKLSDAVSSVSCQLVDPMSGVSVTDLILKSIDSNTKSDTSPCTSEPPSSKPSGSHSSRSDRSSPSGSQKSYESITRDKGRNETGFRDSVKEPSFDSRQRDTSRESTSRRERYRSDEENRERRDAPSSFDSRQRDTSCESTPRRERYRSDEENRERRDAPSSFDSRQRDTSRESTSRRERYRSDEENRERRDVPFKRSESYRDERRSSDYSSRRERSRDGSFESTRRRDESSGRDYHHKRNNSESSQSSYRSGAQDVIDPFRPSLSSPMSGRVSHFVSPLEFYVQPSWNAQKLASTMSSIACFYGDEKRGAVFTDPTTGSYCCALIGDKLQRCKVTEVLPDGSVRVFCLDEGSTHLISSICEEFYVLERQFYYLFSQAVRCSLADFKNLAAEEVSKLSNEIRSAILGRNVEVTFRTDRHGDCYEVDLSVKQSLTEVLSSKRTSTATKGNTEISKVPSTELTAPPFQLLSTGQEEEAMILSISSIGSIYVQLLSSEESMTELTAGIETFMKNPAPHVNLGTNILKVGGIVLGKFTEDDSWYRAIITALSGGTVSLFYFDYGNQEDVPVNRVHPISPSLSSFPRQSIECALEGMEDLAPSGKDFKNMESELFEASCTISVVKCNETNGLHIVRIKLAEGSCDLIEWVLNNGYYTRKPATQTSTATPQGNIERNITAPLGNNEAAAIVTDKKPPGKDGILSQRESERLIKSYPVSVGESLSVYLSYQEDEADDGRKRVWVTPAVQSVELEALRDQLEEEYSSIEADQLIPNPKTGQTCCAKYSADGKWYRALVLAPPSPSILVLFVDYGNTDIVSEVFVLKNELRSLPMSAICCRLESSTEAIEWDEPLSFQFLSQEELPTSCLPLWNVQVTQITSSSVSERCPSPLQRPPSPLKESSIPMLQVKTGEKYEVYISHSESPSLFYCQLVKESQDLDELMAHIADFYTDKFLHLEPEIGSYCAAKYNKNNSWYRAQIIEVIPRSGEEVGETPDVKVLFVDYGNEEVVSPSNMIQKLDCQFTHLPCQALPCSLLSSVRESFTEEQLEAFFSLNFDEDSFTIHLKSLLPSSEWHVELSDQQGTTLNELFTSPSGSPRLPLVGGETTPTYYLPQYQPGSTVDVFVTCVNSPDNFYCQPLGLASQLEELMSTISEFMSSVQAPKPSPLETLEPGQTCLARYSDDSEWYRGQIDSVNIPERKIFVRYVDYGNLFVLDESKVVPLPPQFLSVPVQALHCSVMKPGGEHEDGHKVTPTISERFIRTVKEEEQYVLTVLSSSDSKYFVDVYVGSQKVNFSFLDTMSSPLNTSSRDDELSKDLEISPFHSTDGGAENLLLKMSKSPTTDLEESEEDSTATGEPLIHAPCHLSLVAGETLQVNVVYVKDPSLFYIQRVDCYAELESLSNEIAQYCADCAGQLYQKSYQSGDFVLAQYESDVTWYRAHVLEQVSVDSFLVRFIDYGNKETVTSKNMIMCPGNFLELPVQAIAVSLAQVPSREGWPDEYSKCIVELTEGKELQATVVLPGRQNIPASVSLLDPETGLDIASKVLEELDKECEEGGAPDSKLLLQEGEPISQQDQSSVSVEGSKEGESPSSFDGEDLGTKIETLREKLELVCIKENSSSKIPQESLSQANNNNNTNEGVAKEPTDEMPSTDIVENVEENSKDESNVHVGVKEEELEDVEHKDDDDVVPELSLEGSELEAEQTGNAIETEATAIEQEEEGDEDKEGDLNTDELSNPQEPVDADIPDNVTTPEGAANDEDMNIEEAHIVADICQPNLKEVAPESMDPPKTDEGASILRQYGRINLSGDATGGFSDLKSEATSQLQQTEGASIINTIDTEAADSCTSVQADVDTSETTCLPKTDSTVTIETDQSLKSESLLSTESAAGLQLESATTATKMEHNAEPSASADITESTAAPNEVSLPTLEVGSQYKVFIVSIDSPYDFICHLSGYDPVIEAVSSLLSDIYQFAPEGQYTISNEELVVGQLVCAQFSEDDSYYRARVLHKIDKDYEVEYLDYGNQEVVPLTRIFKLHPQLLTSCYPPFALHCSLSDLPAERKEDEEEIGRLVDAMKGLISEDEPTLMEVVSRPPPGKDYENYEVKLFSRNESVCGEGMETINASISQLLETGSYNSVPGHQKGTKEVVLNERVQMNGSTHLSDIDLNIPIDSKTKGHTTACVEGSNST